MQKSQIDITGDVKELLENGYVFILGDNQETYYFLPFIFKKERDNICTIVNSIELPPNVPIRTMVEMLENEKLTIAKKEINNEVETIDTGS